MPRALAVRFRSCRRGLRKFPRSASVPDCNRRPGRRQFIDSSQFPRAAESDMSTAESRRLSEIRDDVGGWRKWGPYLSERAWGTVREDYSADGNAWAFFSHDQARSKAYRWGEDAIAGV